MSIDLHMPCRTCLASEPEENYVPLFESESESANLATKLAEITSLTVSPHDDMPLQVCPACHIEIERSYAFKRKCERSYSLLHDLQAQSVEIQDEAVQRFNGSPNEQDPQSLEVLKTEDDLNDTDGDVVEILQQEVERIIGNLLTSVDRKIVDEPNECVNAALNGLVQEDIIPESTKDESSTRAEPGKPFPCEICGKAFPKRHILKEHERIHTDKKPFVCSECGARFSLQKYLKKHECTHPGEKTFGCSICAKEFGSKNYLKIHEKCHRETSKVPCITCGKFYVSNKVLKEHVKIHTGAKPYVCSVCG